MKLVVVVYGCAGGIFLNPDESRVPQTIRAVVHFRNWTCATGFGVTQTIPPLFSP
jgi:hypothetical protein